MHVPSRLVVTFAITPTLDDSDHLGVRDRLNSAQVIELTNTCAICGIDVGCSRLDMLDLRYWENGEVNDEWRCECDRRICSVC